MTAIGPGALEGVRVLDIATMAAASWAATYLADYGAEVIKFEHPTQGDPLRRWGSSKDGSPLFWKSLSRNKAHVTLNLGVDEGRDVFLRLVEHADVVVENFRPGVLERWGLGHDVLTTRNPAVILLRTSGFGQTGPYARRPGFGTLAEAMSGLAHITGEPDGPPTLAGYPLADGVAGLAGAMAVLSALYWRDASGGRQGQVIDNAIVDANLRLIEYMVLEHDQLGLVQGRYGNRLPGLSPRNTYRTADGRYVAISGGTTSIVARLFRALGREDLLADPRFATAEARVANVEEVDAVIGEWIGARPLEEVMDAFERHEVAAAPVYDIAQLMADEHVQARQTVTRVKDEDFGEVATVGVHPRLSATPGGIAQMGGAMGRDNERVYRELLGLDDDTLRRLRSRAVI